MARIQSPHLTRWHYTFGDVLVSILQDGLLKLATIDVPASERPALWFSTNSDWENTANKFLRHSNGLVEQLTKEDMHERRRGLARIGVSAEDAVYDWETYKQLSGISREDAEVLYQTGIKMNGNPAEWWVSFDPAPASRWTAVELWDGKHWLPSSKGCAAWAAVSRSEDAAQIWSQTVQRRWQPGARA